MESTYESYAIGPPTLVSADPIGDMTEAMKHELKVPTVGESIQEVQIGQWLKSEGQWADKDESLVEIESDKATVDLAAPVAGIVVQVLHRQGDVVPVGTLIGYLEEAPRPDGAGSRQRRRPAPRRQRRSRSASCRRTAPRLHRPATRPRLRPPRQSSAAAPRPPAAVRSTASRPAPAAALHRSRARAGRKRQERRNSTPSDGRPATQVSALHGAAACRRRSCP